MLDIEMVKWRGRCRSTRFVIAGYSQGAWIVDKFLRQHPEQKKHIAGIALLGDPQWVSGIDAGLAKLFGTWGVSNPYFPKGIGSRMQSWCNFHDPICGRGFASRYGTDAVRGVQLTAAGICAVAKCPHYTYRPTARTAGQFLAYMLQRQLA
jgi:hypothetical protein